MLRRFAAATLAAWLLPTAAFADYGAIAFSPDTGAFGYSYKASSRQNAEDTALKGCRKHADDCFIAIYFRNACGALAMGENYGYGRAWNVDSGVAQRQAMRACQSQDTGCRVLRWQCSG